MQHLGTVALETPRLLLRRFTLEDADDMFANWANDDAVTVFLRWPSHKSIEVSRHVIAQWVGEYDNEKNYQWCIELRETGKAIGSIGVVAINDRVDSAEVGYCIGKAYWHQGITSEAMAAVIDFLFNKVGVNRIEAHHDPRNLNSGKVMLKCGLKYEGTMIQASRNNLGISDCAVYGRINPEKR